MLKCSGLVDTCTLPFATNMEPAHFCIVRSHFTKNKFVWKPDNLVPSWNPKTVTYYIEPYATPSITTVLLS